MCLTKLNDLKYFCSIRDNDVAMLLVNRLCMIIQASDSALIKNYCHFIINLTQSGTNMSGRTYSTCKKWILQGLEFATPESRKPILLALKNIIEIGPLDVICQDMMSLLEDKGFLRTLVTQRNSELTEINLLAINCIEAFILNVEQNNITITPKLKMIIKELIYSTALSSLEKDNCNQLYYYNITCSCLRILRYLVLNKLLNEDPNSIGEICGLIQSSMFYGISGYSNLKPKLLRPALLNIPERIGPPLHSRNIQSTTKLRMKKATNKSTLNNSYEATVMNKFSSDSETSDTEIISPDRASSRVRIEAIYLLHTIIHEIPCRDMFGYWSQIIVDTSGVHTRALVTLINNEPVSKLRQLELGTLAEAIHGARTFLAYAEESDHSTFLTFFGAVSIMIRELHNALSLLLRTEKNVAVIIHALKCVTALIHATPYARLKPQLAVKLIPYCKIYISHTDPTIRVAALSVFEALSSIDKCTPEILSILNEKCKKTFIRNEVLTFTMQSVTINNHDPDVEEVDVADVNKCLYKNEECKSADYEKSCDIDICFLLQICLNNISNKMVQVPVRLQSLKLLGALINDDMQHLVFNHIELTTQHLIEASQEAEPQVALHSCRVIEKISSRCPADLSLKELVLIKLWNMIYEPIISLTQSPHTNLREVACDCLGTIKNEIFSQLSSNKSIVIITKLLGAVKDEESAVRAASLRALGMLVTLPIIEENTEFIINLIDIVCLALEDDNLGVRIKAAWALANLSDCLIKHTNNNDMEPLPLESYLKNLYRVSVKAARDNNKVKCNVLRGVGNIIHLCKDVETLIDVSEGLQALISCATTGNDMKVRWNACRSLGFIMSYAPESILPPDWRDKIFPALCDLICHSPNFKVRTNAAWALAACNFYGKYVPFLWKSIVMALDNSQHVPNFVEYPHREALVQQLCLALGHVAARTNLSDLQILWPEIKDHVQDVAIHIKHFQERVLPEKTDEFMAAKLQMKTYVEIASTSNERKIAEILSDLFELTN
ncbi:hypothetical protein PV328_009820 [Microctonus aethiopoides]|uniref:HEAT repeat-containing protein 6 n=1 Tax=Microctonus aethiopoides TaxID=144406 RepID=A0AA39F129_9HYME|nr:hypothetical protein PV328_009820 [Microctonus aethiopoides]